MGIEKADRATIAIAIVRRAHTPQHLDENVKNMKS